jgi:predicted nuclease of predicted toxin-antitoxin system
MGLGNPRQEIWNLSPEWTTLLEGHGWEATHWSRVGDPRASDRMIMDWARSHGYVVFTHDLDFGALLAVTRAEGPSVIQVRTHDVTPQRAGAFVLAALREHQAVLDRGALISVDEERARARILPLA